MTTSKTRTEVIYWDTSALLKLFFAEEGSLEAARCFRRSPVRILSSLAYAELRSILYRRPELSAPQRNDILEFLETPDWRFALEHPPLKHFPVSGLAAQLRGADLWHLALFRHLATERVPGAKLFTFDTKLSAATRLWVGNDSLVLV